MMEILYLIIIGICFVIIITGYHISDNNYKEFEKQLEESRDKYRTIDNRTIYTIAILQNQKTHLEKKLRKFTSANLYLDFKE